MNASLGRRQAATAGLALAAAVALWWLGSTRLALDKGSNAGRSAADALQALWLVRGIGLALQGPRVGGLRGWRAGADEALGLVAPAWPVVVLAWSASAVAWTHVALAELVLLAAGVALPLIGQGLHRVLRQAEFAQTMATAAGIALAASVWITRHLWPLPLP